MQGVADRCRAAVDTLSSDKARNVVLYLAVGTWIVFRMSWRTCFAAYLYDNPVITGDFVRHRILLLILLCELSRIWSHGYGKRDAAGLLIFSIAAFGLYRNGFFDILCDSALVLAARHSNFRCLLGFSAIVTSIALAVVIACAFAGVVPDFIVARGGRLRHCLGFNYCLFPAQYLFTATLALCVVLDRKAPWPAIAALVLLNAGVFALTDARLSFGLAMLALCVAACRKLPVPVGAWRCVSAAASWAFPVVVVAGVAMVGIYALCQPDVPIPFAAFDKAVGRRIELTYLGLSDMGVSMLGQQVAWVGAGLDAFGNSSPNTYNYVDNLFFHSLIEFGAVYTSTLFALYFAASRKARSQGDFMLVSALAVLAFHFLLDDLALMLDYNALLFVVGPYLFSRREERELVAGG